MDGVWVKVCPQCGGNVVAAIFRIPAAAAYGVTSQYVCDKCGSVANPIEIEVKVNKRKKGA